MKLANPIALNQKQVYLAASCLTSKSYLWAEQRERSFLGTNKAVTLGSGGKLYIKQKGHCFQHGFGEKRGANAAGRCCRKVWEHSRECSRVTPQPWRLQEPSTLWPFVNGNGKTVLKQMFVASQYL